MLWSDLGLNTLSFCLCLKSSIITIVDSKEGFLMISILSGTFNTNKLLVTPYECDLQYRMEMFVFNSINIAIIGHKWPRKLLKVHSAVFYTCCLHYRKLKYHFDNELMSFWLESGIKNNAVCFMVFWLPGAIVVELRAVSILLFQSFCF